MKKIILIALSCIMLLSIFVISASARNEDNYIYVLAFDNNEKAYPIMESIYDFVGFYDYYGGKELDLKFNIVDTGGYFRIRSSLTDFQISFIKFDGSNPVWCYDVPNVVTYNDFAIVNEDASIYLVGVFNGEAEKICDITTFKTVLGSSEQFSFYFTNKNNLENHYVEFPTCSEVKEENDNFITIIIFVLGAFVVGIGATFSSAFTALFLTNGVLNSLAIFLLVFFGISLAVGIVYFITKTVIKKGD